jgi:PAS domain S-box-containing protein
MANNGLDCTTLLQILASVEDAVFTIDTTGKVSYANEKAMQMAPDLPVIGEDYRKVLPDLEGYKFPSETTWEIYGRKYRAKLDKSTVVASNVLVILQDSESAIAWQDEENDIVRIFESLADGIYITNSDGQTLFMNSACGAITGLRKDIVSGKNVKDLVERGMIIDSSTLEVMKSGTPKTILQRTISGKTVLVTAKVVMDTSGQVRFIVSTTRDITELNFIKAQLEKERLLSNHYLSEMTTPQMTVYSQKMININELASHVAKTDSTVLITGESGTGKDVLCRFIHSRSPRAKQPFIKVNCAAIPEQLMESELFGYESGAFTGAKKTGKPGLIELADKGTIFFDEIAEMPLNMQAKLLQVLQEKAFFPIGGTKPRRVDTRIIVATNRDLRKLVAEGKFREDLFYRLNVIPIGIPPLRERREEIPHMAEYFLERVNQKYGMAKTIGDEVFAALQVYDWPGNVRELENCVEQMVVVSMDDLLTADHLPVHLRIRSEQKGVIVTDIMPLSEAIEILEKQLLEMAYKATGSTYKAAKLLGISQPTASRKLSRIKD